MRKKRITLAMLAAIFSAGTLMLSAPGSADEKPTLAKSCGLPGCHSPEKGVLRGNLGNVSGKAETLQIDTGAVWIVKFDDSTKLIGWSQPVNKIPKEKELAVTYAEKNGQLFAQSISVKPAAKVRDEQIVKAEEMKRLVAMGPAKGSFTLIDSRPAPKFDEGHIPGAINIFDAQFDKNLDKLPKEKDKLLIFYCAGPT